MIGENGKTIYIERMTSEAAIDRLRNCRGELEQAGIIALSVFGSRARGDNHEGSDLDLAVRFRKNAHIGGFRFVALEKRLEEIAGLEVDLVVEPARKARVQREIDRTRRNVF